MHATRGNGQNDDAARPAVAWVDGTIRLVDDRLFDRNRPGACRKFLARIFRLSEIRSLEIDFIARQAVIQYDVTSRTAAEVLAPGHRDARWERGRRSRHGRAPALALGKPAHDQDFSTRITALHVGDSE